MSKENISASRRVARMRVVLLSLLVTIVVVAGVLYYKSEQIIRGAGQFLWARGPGKFAGPASMWQGASLELWCRMLGLSLEDATSPVAGSPMEAVSSSAAETNSGIQRPNPALCSQGKQSAS